MKSTIGVGLIGSASVYIGSSCDRNAEHGRIRRQVECGRARQGLLAPAGKSKWGRRYSHPRRRSELPITPSHHSRRGLLRGWPCRVALRSSISPVPTARTASSRQRRTGSERPARGCGLNALPHQRQDIPGGAFVWRKTGIAACSKPPWIRRRSSPSFISTAPSEAPAGVALEAFPRSSNARIFRSRHSRQFRIS